MDSSKTTDQLKSIENAIGSIYSDTIIGNHHNNDIVSNGGNDNISAEAGGDTIYLNVDDNNPIFRATVDGGAGNDTLYIDKSSTDFEIISDGDSLLTTQLLLPNKSEFSEIYITNTEQIHFTDIVLAPSLFEANP